MPREGRCQPRSSAVAIALLVGATLLARSAELAASVPVAPAPRSESPLPWREAGLSERQAAAHLLDRFAFGARPGDIERVVGEGLDRWFERQLAAAAPEPRLATQLRTLDALAMSSAKLHETFPEGFVLRQRAEEAGVISAAELRDAQSEPAQQALRRRLEEWGRGQGYRSERELLGQLMAAKLLRAVYAENQLQEVLTDFWFNHFNVSLTNNASRTWLLGYERDAIRPHVTGSFRMLLEATAKHPAMLTYLDNFRSVAADGAPTTVDREINRFDGGRRRPRSVGGGAGFDRLGMDADAMRSRVRRERDRAKDHPNRPQGLNENYARELLELHTLGVDGGYSQDDVIAVARAFTGWTMVPPRAENEERVQKVIDRVGRAGGLGFVREGDFFFRADAHDAGAKRVLGVELPAGRGLEDGEQVLDLVAAHPATATHLARDVAIRFVSDDPPPALVARLAATFTATHGDLAAMLRAIVAAPEFWAPASSAAKIKSPFEVVVSSLRALDAEIANPFPLLGWIQRMGEPLYAYQAPTGYPDRADFWVNTGALLNRMNFGLELATGRIGGVRFDLAALDRGREPESAQAALATYAALLMPERDLASTVDKLTPLVTSPDLAARIAGRAPKSEIGDDPLALLDRDAEPMAGGALRPPRGERGRDPFARGALPNRYFPAALPMAGPGDPPTTVASVVGLVLGSPEFQRR